MVVASLVLASDAAHGLEIFGYANRAPFGVQLARSLEANSRLNGAESKVRVKFNSRGGQRSNCRVWCR
jgi:hypothetical protein